MARAATTTDAFNAVAEPQRRRILTLLKGRERSVNELAGALRVSQPSVSKHLRVLRKVGLVSMREAGQQRLYKLDARGLKPIHDWVGGFEEFWSQSFDRLNAYVKRLQRKEGEGRRRMMVVGSTLATSDREIVVTRIIEGPRPLVFEAYTDPRHLAHWWGPNGFTTTTRAFEFRPGGVWDFVMHGPDGTDYPNWIEWREIEPPERLVFLHGDRPDDPRAFVSTVTLVERGGATEVTMRAVFKTKAQRDEVVARYDAIEGGKQTLGRLALYVTTLIPERTLTMRRLVMWNLQTLDGYFEGKAPWDLEFHDAAWGDELKQFSLEQTREVGTLLYGRATYEGMASHWTTATGPIADFMNDVPKVVFSRTLDAATWKNTRLVRRDAADEVAELKRGEGKDLFVFGSAKLCDSLMRRGLFDELRVCVAPVVLGTGVPLFKQSSPRQNLTLLQARPLATGGVILRYAAKPRDA